MAKQVDILDDGTLIVNTRHYGRVGRVLIQHGNEGTFCYPDDMEAGEIKKITTLTTKEKADRYDALQAAFKATIDNYRARLEDAEKEQNNDTVIGVYEKGRRDTYKAVIEDIERWTI